MDETGAKIRQAEREGSQVFQGNYLPYATIVQQIMALALTRRPDGDDGPVNESEREKLLFALHAQVQATSSAYAAIATSLVKAGSGARRWWARKLRKWDVRVKNPSLPQSSTNSYLMQQLAKECLAFGEVNKVALGRMVGLYEQQIGDGMGSKYLEECWDPQSGNQAHFLISPLTEELRALAVDVAPASPRLGGCGLFRVCPIDEEDEDCFEDDKDSIFKCPICFEVKYKPIALACGHSFCKMCLLDSSRLTTVVTNSFTTKLRVADKHLHAKCPMCKREGVFEKAIQLKALGNLASELYRKEWAEKRQEDRQRDQVIMHAFINKQGVKITSEGLTIDKDVSGAVWTHRSLADPPRASPRRGS